MPWVELIGQSIITHKLLPKLLLLPHNVYNTHLFRKNLLS